VQPSTGAMTILHTLAGMGLFLGICAAIALILAVALAGLARLEP
jgi:hypothetical protein